MDDEEATMVSCLMLIIVMALSPAIVYIARLIF